MAPTPTARRALAALAVVAVLTTGAAGCDSDSDAPDAAGSPSTGPTPTASRSVPAPAVTAADGTDTAACQDADCEVTATGPVTIRFKGPKGRATLSVTKVGPNEVEYTITSGDGHSKGAASGPGHGCTTYLHSNSSGTSCGGILGGTRPSAQPGAVVIQVTGHADGTALLHMVSP